MIEGIKLDFRAQEVRKHAVARAEHHRQRETFYNEQADALEKGSRGDENAPNPFSNTTQGQDPVKALRRDGVAHSHKARFFELIASHLVDGEVYRLDEQDLIRYEFSSVRGY